MVGLSLFGIMFKILRISLRIVVKIIEIIVNFKVIYNFELIVFKFWVNKLIKVWLFVFLFVKDVLLDFKYLLMIFL